MDYQTIAYEKQDRIAKVILNRPRYKNAQSRLMLEEVDHALLAANADDDVRVIVMSGAGDSFSSGHDNGTPEEKEDRLQRPFPTGMPAEYGRSRQLFLDNTLRWRNLDKPTIAQVQGWCIFGGWMFAAAMDLVVAADDAKFMPGLFQYFSIPWDLPPRKAKEILFQSRILTADEACRYGFIATVVPRDRLEEETLALAKRIAENDPFMIRMAKWAVNSAQDAMGFNTSIRSAHSHQMLLRAYGLMEARTDAAGAGAVNRPNPLVDQARKHAKE